MSQGEAPDLLAMLARINERITELRDMVVEQRSFKDRYSTAEARKSLKGLNLR